MRHNKLSDLGQVSTQTGGYRPSQPSQKYPFQPIEPPRSDNANQPWYPMAEQSRWWGSGPGDYQDYDPITQTDPQGEPSQNMNSIWTNFNQFFGGQDAKSNLVNKSDVVGPVPGGDETGAITTKPGFWESVNSFFANLQKGTPVGVPQVDKDFGG